MRWAQHTAHMGEIRNEYRTCIRIPEGKIKLEWILGKWWEGVDLIHLPQNRGQCQTPVNMLINLQVP